ncbi:MAG: hypothetical protein Fur0037_27420 [Planctomycetota bacterium]
MFRLGLAAAAEIAVLVRTAWFHPDRRGSSSESSAFRGIRCDPDPEVVRDADVRRRIEARGLPWMVEDHAIGVEMVRIPEGEFTMGSPRNEAGRDDDETQHHRVIRKAFYLGRTEVTQGLWQRITDNDPSLHGNRPVENASWNDCQEFLKRAGSSLRLPREAEWEYACRAGAEARFSFGEDNAALGGHGWYWANSGGETHEVGQKKPNAFGPCDMHGNVPERCLDRS